MVFGLDGLSTADSEKVSSSNIITLITFRIIKRVAKAGRPVILENPQSSSVCVWIVSELKQIAGMFNAEWVVVDYCQYGTSWQKPTTLLVFNLPGLGDVFEEMQPPRKVCAP